MTRAGCAVVALLLVACAAFRAPDLGEQIAPNVAALHAAGFDFAADVAFRHDPLAVCDGIACADVHLEAGRRTIALADGAFQNDSRLRASLLEVWSRYQLPRRPSAVDSAQSALFVVRHGRRVGVTTAILRDARESYRLIYDRIPADKRGDLPAPATLEVD